jgi:hypothetical protein
MSEEEKSMEKMMVYIEKGIKLPTIVSEFRRTFFEILCISMRYKALLEKLYMRSIEIKKRIFKYWINESNVFSLKIKDDKELCNDIINYREEIRKIRIMS